MTAVRVLITGGLLLSVELKLRDVFRCAPIGGQSGAGGAHPSTGREHSSNAGGLSSGRSTAILRPTGRRECAQLNSRRSPRRVNSGGPRLLKQGKEAPVFWFARR